MRKATLQIQVEGRISIGTIAFANGTSVTKADGGSLNINAATIDSILCDCGEGDEQNQHNDYNSNDNCDRYAEVPVLSASWIHVISIFALMMRLFIIAGYGRLIVIVCMSLTNLGV